MHGRVSGRDTIQFTGKLVGPSGEFASVIVLSLDCEELSRFYQTLDLGGGFVGLMSTDLTILARGPFAKNVLGKPLASSAALHDLTMRDSGFCTRRRPAVGRVFLAAIATWWITRLSSWLDWTFRLPVVCEGVETEQQLDMLRHFGSPRCKATSWRDQCLTLADFIRGRSPRVMLPPKFSCPACSHLASAAG